MRLKRQQKAGCSQCKNSTISKLKASSLIPTADLLFQLCTEKSNVKIHCGPNPAWTRSVCQVISQ